MVGGVFCYEGEVLVVQFEETDSITSAVRKLGGGWLYPQLLSPFYSVQAPGPWDATTYIKGDSFPFYWSNLDLPSVAQPQIVSMVILNLIKPSRLTITGIINRELGHSA